MIALFRIFAVLAAEFRIALRNRWVALATATLTLFALALAFVGSAPGGEVKADGLVLTAASLATLSVYLVPLMALLLSYDALAGEVERGTLALVLATPLRRSELMAAKFLGALGVLGLAVIVGYGLAGVLVVVLKGWSVEGAVVWCRLIGTSVLLGAVFLAMGLMFSALSRQTGTAAAMAIGGWLVLVVLYDLMLLGGIVVDGGGIFTKLLFPYLVLANPGDAFRLFNLALIDGTAPISGLDGLARTLPFPPATALIALIFWLGALLGAAHLLIRRITP